MLVHTPKEEETVDRARQQSGRRCVHERRRVVGIVVEEPAGILLKCLSDHPSAGIKNSLCVQGADTFRHGFPVPSWQDPFVVISSS